MLGGRQWGWSDDQSGDRVSWRGDQSADRVCWSDDQSATSGEGVMTRQPTVGLKG